MSRSCWYAVPAAACSLLALCPTATAQKAASRPITGVVTDSVAGVGINGAEVLLEGTSLRTVTGEQGMFRLEGTPEGDGTLRVRRLGFHPKSVLVRGAADHVQVQLSASVQMLASVIVRAERGRYTGRLAGYYERLERRTQGQFITRADLEREHPAQLTDMLQRSPGIRITRGRPGAQSVRMRGRDCRPLIWIDGAPMSAADVDLDSFSPESLEGIELYLGAASAPQRYQGPRGRSECGTVLLWSRGPDTDPIRRGAAASPTELEALVAAHTVYTADEVDLPAALDSASLPAITYPPSLRAAGVGGLVIAEFVVDARGRVEEENFNILSSTSPLLMAAVQDAIRGAAFRPALRGGQAVRQLVRQPFEFQPLSK